MKNPATPTLRRNGTGRTTRASRLMATVSPEKTTARPACCIACVTAVSLSTPFAASSLQRVTTSNE